MRSARSVVSIIGACRFDGSCASGTVPSPSAPFGFHWFAPAGLFVRSPSALEAAGDRRVAVAASEAVFPAQSLLLDRRTLGLGPDVLLRIGGAVNFAER